MKVAALVCLALACGGTAPVRGGAGGGVELGDAPQYVAGADTATAIARAAARAGCERLFGDCHSQCSQLFARCGNSVDECVDNYAGQELGSTPNPWSSAALANTCVQQLKTGACATLGASVECDAAIEQGCPGDTGPGSYSYLVAPDVGPLPASLTVHHCGSPVTKWLKLDLPVGVRLVITSPGYSGTSARVRFGRLRDGQDLPDTFGTIDLAPGFEHTSAAVNIAGTYYLRITLSGAEAPADLKLQISTVPE